MRAIAITVSLFCVLLTVPCPVVAQDRVGEVAGGYSFLRDFQAKENFPAAWFASGAYNITNWLAAVGEVGGSYKSTDFVVDSVSYSTTTRLHTVLVGGRYSRRVKSAAAFLQVLAGPAWESGGTTIFRESVGPTDRKIALQPGGGIDIPLTGRLGLRLGADYRRIFADRRTTPEKNNNEFRLNLGLVAGL